jgi:titin
MHPFIRWVRRLSGGGTLLAARPPHVEALEDRLLLTAYVVTTTKDQLNDTTQGEVTLRDAITALDGTPSGNATVVGTASNTISFQIPGSGPQSINVGSDPSALNQPLPGLTKPVFIDGLSQGGQRQALTPQIVLNGASAGSGASGLVLNPGSDQSAVRGLVIEQFAVDGIDVLGTSGNLITGNYIGTDAAGTTALGNVGDGIFLAADSTGNTLGGAIASAANLISGNDVGVEIGGHIADNFVVGNLIGTDINGSTSLGNVFGLGLDGSNDTIDDTTAPALNTIEGNTVELGLFPGATGNTLLRLRLGTNAAGTAALQVPNVFGLVIEGANNTVGGATYQGLANVISGNANSGLLLDGFTATGNLIRFNFLGTDVNGTASLANGNAGVFLVQGANLNTVGAGNVISANSANGVQMEGAGVVGNVVLGNLIGTDVSGSAALANGAAGVLLANAVSQNTIGGTAIGAGNLVSGNGDGGVVFGDGGPSGNVVQGNRIGTDIHGTAKLGNATDGIDIDAGATGNTLGGTAPGAANLISGNGNEGITIFGSGTSGNLVLGNILGTDRNGTINLGNARDGVLIETGAAANTVGGRAAGAGNVIAANVNGVEISGPGSARNVVLGNLIGTDPAGTAAPFGNFNENVLVDGGAAANTIGGIAPGSGNVISGGQKGLEIASAGSSGNVVVGNLVGTDRTGTIGLPNFDVGVEIVGGATNNTIGGTTRGARNLISDNTVAGVHIVALNGDGGTSGNVVLGDRIGTDISGSAPLGNGDGVLIEGGATRNTVGGTTAGAANAIAFNAKGVVLVDNTTTGDSILGNSIWGNTGPGIDLGDDGPTPNGPNPRAFPNDGQNKPVLTALTLNSVSGTLTSVPRTRFRIEFFATPAAGTSNQGQFFLGASTVTTNAAGSVAFTAPVATIPPGMVVTSTATNLSNGDTSEFSPVGLQLLVLSSPVIPFSRQAQVVTLSAQLLSGNTPVSGVSVTFTVAGLPGRVTGVTNSNGVATVHFTIPGGTPPARYIITAAVPFTEELGAATGEGFLTIVSPSRFVGRRWVR